MNTALPVWSDEIEPASTSVFLQSFIPDKGRNISLIPLDIPYTFCTTHFHFHIILRSAIMFSYFSSSLISKDWPRSKGENLVISVKVHDHAHRYIKFVSVL